MVKFIYVVKARLSNAGLSLPPKRLGGRAFVYIHWYKLGSMRVKLSAKN